MPVRVSVKPVPVAVPSARLTVTGPMAVVYSAKYRCRLSRHLLPAAALEFVVAFAAIEFVVTTTAVELVFVGSASQFFVGRRTSLRSAT